MKVWAKGFYTGNVWKRCRNSYYLSQHGVCEHCGGAGEIVHHKIKLTPKNINDPNVSLNFDNIELLCRKCHGHEHGNFNTEYGLMFDENGNLLQYTKMVI